jgi:cytochrome c oxidase subunit 4
MQTHTTEPHSISEAPPAEHAAHAHHPHVNYFGIFIALCFCTLLSAAFDFVPLNRRVVAVLVLAVAVAKAQYVMRYFMHLKFEGKWKFVLLLPTAILACGIPLALAPDIGLHYYTPSTPQLREHSEARGGHGEASPGSAPAGVEEHSETEAHH